MEHDHAAHCEAGDGSQGGDLQEVGAQAEDIGHDGADGKDEANYIQPQRGMDRNTNIPAQPNLEQQGSQPNRRNHHQRQRAQEGAAAGVDHHQSKGQQKKASGENGPAPWLGRG